MGSNIIASLFANNPSFCPLVLPLGAAVGKANTSSVPLVQVARVAVAPMPGAAAAVQPAGGASQLFYEESHSTPIAQMRQGHNSPRLGGVVQEALGVDKAHRRRIVLLRLLAQLLQRLQSDNFRL